MAWFVFAWRVDWLTAGLSILAITLTQMVLNRQHEREKEAHRRDVALHAKLDELLIASQRARDELAGIEELEEEEIEELREAGARHPASARPAQGGALDLPGIRRGACRLPLPNRPLTPYHGTAATG